MFTICTGCQRQFRVLAAHLSAANGLVKCGYCGEQFNALEYLSDEPLNHHNTDSEIENNIEQENIPVEETLLDTELQEQALEQETELEPDETLDEPEDELQTEENIEPEPEFDLGEHGLEEFPIEIPEATESEEEERQEIELEETIDENVSEEAMESQFEDEPGITDPLKEEAFEIELPDETISDEEETEINIDLLEVNAAEEPLPAIDDVAENLAPDPTTDPAFPEEESNTDTSNTADIIENELPQDIPEELLTEPSEKPGRASFYLWSLGCVALVLIVGAQLAWFNRDQLYRQYPQALPYAKQLCARLQCSVYRQENFSDIELVSRDVRVHPSFADSLLVNAVMANRSDKQIDYPNLQLSLYDTDGRMVSYRQFQAKDYLDESVSIESGMAPDTPVHFVLELSGYLQSAVSFEFDFY